MQMESARARFIARVQVIDIGHKEDLERLRHLEADPEVFFKLDHRRARDASLEVNVPQAPAREDPAVRRQVRRNGYGEGDIARELFHLARMHRAVPDSVAKPLAAIVSDGKILGYAMGRINGMTLQKYLGLYSDSLVSREDLDQVHARIRSVFKALHRKRIGHGDAIDRNIIIADGDRVVLIDPSSRSQVYTSYNGIRYSRIARDRIQLSELLRE